MKKISYKNIASFLNDFLSIQKASYFFVFFSGVLFYLSFPNIFTLKGYPLCSFLFGVFLFFALEGNKVWRRMGHGIIFGLVSYLLLVNWIYPIDIFGYLLFSLSMAIQVVLFSLFYREDFMTTDMSLLFVPGLWVASEYFRSIVLGGFSWTLGHSLSFYPQLIQVMEITGPYGLSFLIMFVNVCLYRLIKGGVKVSIYGSLIFIVLFGSFAYSQLSLSFLQRATALKSAQVCAVQPNIPPEVKLDPNRLNECLDLQMDMSYACISKSNPFIIFWPEVALADDFTQNAEMLKKIEGLSRELNVSVLLGAALNRNSQDYNSAVLIDPQEGLSQVYHKRKLIPFAEYSPLKKGWGKEWFYKNSYEFSPGKEAGIVRLIDRTDLNHQINIGAMICSEEGYPGIIKEITNQNVCFLVSLLNDGWFKQPEALLMHAQMAIVQAVSFRVPIVRTSNTGWSGLIDAQGLFVQRNSPLNGDNLQLNDKKIFPLNVSCKKMKSFYSQYGDVFPVLCLLYVFIMWIFKSKPINPNDYEKKAD